MKNCTRCNAVNEDKASFCNTCGTPLEKKARRCPKCKSVLTEGAHRCLNCGCKIYKDPIPDTNILIDGNVEYTDKSRYVAAALALGFNIISLLAFGADNFFGGSFFYFIGNIGIYNFYLGDKSKGILQLALTMLSCGFFSPVVMVWTTIDGIKLLVKRNYRDSLGRQFKH